MVIDREIVIMLYFGNVYSVGNLFLYWKIRGLLYLVKYLYLNVLVEGWCFVEKYEVIYF